MIKGFFYVIFVVMVLFLAKDNDMLICGSVGVWERASLLPLVLDFSVLPHTVTMALLALFLFQLASGVIPTAAHRPQG